MVAEWYAARAERRRTLREHPDWSVPRLGLALGRSTRWVKKWRRCLQIPPHRQEDDLRGHVVLSEHGSRVRGEGAAAAPTKETLAAGAIVAVPQRVRTVAGRARGHEPPTLPTRADADSSTGR
jgi:hypothetical protein